MLIIGIIVSVIVYSITKNILFDEYGKKLSNAAKYIENNADADDLRECINTGVSSQKRDELQIFLNNMIDDLGFDYIYIVTFDDNKPGTMINVVSATSAAEFAAGETDMPLLQEESDSYSEEQLSVYKNCWNASSVVFFEESSDYGDYYTACKPLRGSDGDTVALICIDISSENLYFTLHYITTIAAALVIAIVVIFSVISIIVLNLKATKPIIGIMNGAKDFAKKSEEMAAVDELYFKKPYIDTAELASLADSIETMANSMREYVSKAIDAETRVAVMEEKNRLLEEKALAEAKINRLTESMNSMFTNMPIMAFAKDAQTGVYNACNQIFATYSGFATTDEIIGKTDEDLFTPEVAKHFRETDEIVMSMDGPYVYTEDVINAKNEPQQFQTTKIKYVDSQGKLCILGMCFDSTELMISKQQSKEAQEAYEQMRSASLTYANIARALALDYSYLYYVDIETNEFLEYHSDTSSDNLVPERKGDDFFAQSIEDARTKVYPADQEAVLSAFNKENILKTIEKHGTFTLSYRLMIDGVPTYVNMKATRMVRDDKHLVVGVNNVDAQMRIQEEMERAKEERITFSRISALTRNYICIYTVDPKTEHYTEYNVSSTYEQLQLPKEGENFFAASLERAENVIYPEDLERFSTMFTKENVLKAIKKNGIFALEYRLILNGVPTYVMAKAAVVEEVDGPQLVVGVSDIDAQIKREQEYVKNLSKEHKKAYVDVLTGLQNKHSYVDLEEQLNRRIEVGERIEFAVVVLDINGLKVTNDTKGHSKGDELIINGAKTVTEVFTHSPVFRIGGDEFVVVAHGEDYDKIDDLIAEIARKNAINMKKDEVVLACGMARFEGDNKVATVFERADSNMYINKKFLKSNKK